MADRARDILDSEPEHPDPGVTYTHRHHDRRFTLRRFVAPHRLALIGAILLVIIETLSVQAGPVLTQIAIDHGIRNQSRAALVVVGVVYLASVVLSVVMGRMRIDFTGRLGEKLMYELRVRVFTHLQRLSLDFYTDEKAGRLMSRMTSDIDSMTALFQEGFVNLAVQGLTLIVVTVALFTYNATLAAIVLVAVLPFMLALTLWFRSRSEWGYEQVRERIAEVLADLQESLSGIRIIAAHNRRRHNVVAHRNVVGSNRDANVYTARIGALYGPGTEIVGILGQAMVLLVGGNMVLNGDLTIGELTAFVLFLTAFFAPIQQLVQLYNVYQQGQAAAAKLREVLETPPSVSEAPDAIELPTIAGEIRLHGVTFGYDPATPILRDVDLHIRPGETFALVGETGAGKSTIAKLITRFYDPQAGTVAIDGHDIAGVTLASLRRQIGVVPQEPFLFAGTVRDNIGFADPDADDQAIDTAIDAVGIRSLVDRMEHGVDTVIHERGSSLSSGERQLLALARAFLARPRVLVLDEATSNLDLESEALIERALDIVLEGRTAVIIAHRLATAMRANRIAVIDDGRVVELGTHDELVALGGRYAAMYETWERHAEPTAP